MSAVNGAGMWAGEQLLAYAVDEAAHAAAGEVCAPYGSGEEDVTAEDAFLFLEFVGYSIGGVTGDVADAPLLSTPFCTSACRTEGIVHSEWLHVQATTPAAGSEQFEREITAVGHAGMYPAVGCCDQGCDSLYMIEVLVGDEQIGQEGSLGQTFFDPVCKAQRSIDGNIAFAALHQITIAHTWSAGVYLNISTHGANYTFFCTDGKPILRVAASGCAEGYEKPQRDGLSAVAERFCGLSYFFTMKGMGAAVSTTSTGL